MYLRNIDKCLSFNKYKNNNSNNKFCDIHTL